MRHIRSIPRYVLPVGTQGSTHTPTSDLAEQPAYKFTDINTPEEDTALDEPDTEIENWEAELAARRAQHTAFAAA